MDTWNLKTPQDVVEYSKKQKIIEWITTQYDALKSELLKYYLSKRYF